MKLTSLLAPKTNDINSREAIGIPTEISNPSESDITNLLSKKPLSGEMYFIALVDDAKPDSDYSLSAIVELNDLMQPEWKLIYKGEAGDYYSPDDVIIFETQVERLFKDYLRGNTSLPSSVQWKSLKEDYAPDYAGTLNNSAVNEATIKSLNTGSRTKLIIAAVIIISFIVGFIVTTIKTIEDQSSNSSNSLTTNESDKAKKIIDESKLKSLIDLYEADSGWTLDRASESSSSGSISTSWDVASGTTEIEFDDAWQRIITAENFIDDSKYKTCIKAGELFEGETTKYGRCLREGYVNIDGQKYAVNARATIYNDSLDTEQIRLYIYAD